jgi:chromate transporter
MANGRSDNRQRGCVLEILVVFLRLGLTSFGGPIVHLGYFREKFAARRRWLSEAADADLVALCQFLPGPASSQTGFAAGASVRWLARGARRLGGIDASIRAGLGSLRLRPLALVNGVGASVIAGLKVLAVASVAHALLGMGRNLCPDLTSPAAWHHRNLM